MARNISRAEAWERAHEVFTQVNFNAFDYNTIKESLLDYMKLYYPEDFNDYIESSEFVALMELFAYVGELLAYRLDLNAHENFITTAQRKESILRLAKLISYKASRNIPARGLVKMTSIQTSEAVFDSAGRNLSGRKIIWNDNNNADWKEQFLLVMNRVLEQPFGTVTPNERVQVDDVLFELYTLNNNPLNTTGKSILSYSAVVSNESYPMELVPSQLTSSGPQEKRPEANGKFSILYTSDGLGDASDTTGFMIFTKQGALQRVQTTFDGITPNQTYDVTTNDINETDIWVNNVDPDTRAILTNDPLEDILPHTTSDSLRYGEWVMVDLGNAQNILFNTNKNRRKYEVETLDLDQVRLIFGDGEFADIPSGSFDIWFRTSSNTELAIPRTSVINKTSSFTYNDALGNVQTFSFSFSLISSLLNASPSEDIEHIRRVAPSVYYTQDRMVNGRDYNSFPLQNPTILKLRSVNRTFAGDSKYLAWHDPSETYENVKIFGDDLALYWTDRDPENGGLLTVTNILSTDPTTIARTLVENYVEPLLCSLNNTANFWPVIAKRLQGDEPAKEIRCEFENTGNVDDEYTTIVTAIVQDVINNASTTTVELWYSPVYDEWTVGQHTCDENAGQNICALGGAKSVKLITIEAVYGTLSTPQSWNIRWRTERLIAHSKETLFWNTNDSSKVIDFDTLNTVEDKITILKANPNANEDALLPSNVDVMVLGHELVEEQQLPNAGLPDQHRLFVMTPDSNGDGIPDNIDLPSILNKEVLIIKSELVAGSPGNVVTPPEVPPTITIPSPYTVYHSNSGSGPSVAGYRLRYDPINGLVVETRQANTLEPVGSTVGWVQVGSPIATPSVAYNLKWSATSTSGLAATGTYVSAPGTYFAECAVPGTGCDYTHGPGLETFMEFSMINQGSGLNSGVTTIEIRNASTQAVLATVVVTLEAQKSAAVVPVQLLSETGAVFITAKREVPGTLGLNGGQDATFWGYGSYYDTPDEYPTNYPPLGSVSGAGNTVGSVQGYVYYMTTVRERFVHTSSDSSFDFPITESTLKVRYTGGPAPLQQNSFTSITFGPFAQGTLLTSAATFTALPTGGEWVWTSAGSPSSPDYCLPTFTVTTVGG